MADWPEGEKAPFPAAFLLLVWQAEAWFAASGVAVLRAVPVPSVSLCVCAMGLGIKKRQFVIKKAVSFSNEVFIHAVQINTTRNGAS